MSDDPYLILHKVRGAPAFDIAIRDDSMGTPSDPGPWWIIPTSGHRAYPARQWLLEDLADVSDINKYGFHSRPLAYDELPEDLPDHYADRPSPLAPRLGGLLAALGLGRSPPIKRRKV